MFSINPEKFCYRIIVTNRTKKRRTSSLERRTLILFLLLFFCKYDLVLADRVTYVDQAGRTVRVLACPQRVISFAPSVTEIVYAVGAGHLLVGATNFSDYPPVAANLPKVGSYVSLHLEKIVCLRPDLCIAIKDGNPIDVIKRLEELNIPVYVVDPVNIATLMEAISGIGKLLNSQRQAEHVVSQIKETVLHLQNKLKHIKVRPRVLYQLSFEPLITIGRDTMIDEIIEIAGGDNIAHNLTCYPRMNMEKILSLSPDVIIIPSMAGASYASEMKKMWQKWPTVNAVKKNRIFIVDSSLFDRPGPRIVQALEKMASILHPELFHQ